MKHTSDNPIRHTDITRRRLLAGMAVAPVALLLGNRLGGTAHAADPKTVKLVIYDSDGKRAGERRVHKVIRTEAEWKKQLSPEAYRITRQNGTEPAFSGDYTKPDRPGFYRCICCDNALYDAATQFHSGTGWPSFWQPLARENIVEQTDRSFFMTRTAVSCKRCDAHLGHVFHDGPQPTGLRFCMDSVALRFIPTGSA